jgi:outer membrane protein OmpA-like peptidoglycan-associated protein
MRSIRTWVAFAAAVALALVAVAPSAVAQQKPLKDFAGHKDPALFTRMPGFFLVNQGAITEKSFDRYEFYVKGEKGRGRSPIEGHFVTYAYTLDKGSGQTPSSLEIMRNYQAAAAKFGGKVLWEDTYRTTILIVKDGKETWVEVNPVPAGYAYTLRIMERQAMEQRVVADAAAFKAGLAETGHVEVPGIYFDTAKADIKPESEAALNEVVKLLQADPALKVWVVGHTDNTGVEQANVTLSQARAAAVVKALATKGVAPARLSAHGAGPYAPVTENRTDEGRAKNRRVELVAR